MHVGKNENCEITTKTYARDVTRPPRLNFLPFNTRAGTIGTVDGIGDDVRF